MVGRGDKWRQTINLSGAHLLHHIQDRISGRCTGFKGRVQSGACFRKISLYNLYTSPRNLSHQEVNMVVLGKVSYVFITGHQRSINRPLSLLGSCWYFEVDVLPMFQLSCIVFHYFDPNSDGTRLIYLPMRYRLVCVPADFQLLFDAESGKRISVGSYRLHVTECTQSGHLIDPVGPWGDEWGPCWNTDRPQDPEGLRVFYYLVQDAICTRGDMDGHGDMFCWSILKYLEAMSFFSCSFFFLSHPFSFFDFVEAISEGPEMFRLQPDWSALPNQASLRERHVTL